MVNLLLFSMFLGSRPDCKTGIKTLEHLVVVIRRVTLFVLIKNESRSTVHNNVLDKFPFVLFVNYHNFPNCFLALVHQVICPDKLHPVDYPQIRNYPLCVIGHLSHMMLFLFPAWKTEMFKTIE